MYFVKTAYYQQQFEEGKTMISSLIKVLFGKITKTSDQFLDSNFIVITDKHKISNVFD